MMFVVDYATIVQIDKNFVADCATIVYMQIERVFVVDCATIVQIDKNFVVDCATIVQIDRNFVVDGATILFVHSRTLNSSVVHSTMMYDNQSISDFQYDIYTSTEYYL